MLLRSLKRAIGLRSLFQIGTCTGSKYFNMSSLGTIGEGGGGEGEKGAKESASLSNIHRAIVSEKLVAISPHTIENLYVPIYDYLLCELREIRTDPSDLKRTLFVGLSAPQGCGKTTLSKVIKTALSYENISCLCMSLDDFYLRAIDQLSLAASYPSNGLLKYRGNAGTHDVQLIKSTLQALKTGATISEGSKEQYSETIIVPKYDKTLNGGRGDRSQEVEVLSSKVDIVLLEGWMMGFTKVPDEALVLPDSALSSDGNLSKNDVQEVNDFLSNYKDIYDFIDSWIILHVDDLSIIYEWREAAEKNSRDYGKPALSKAEVRDFINRFIPAYVNYVPRLLDIENNMLHSKSTMKIKVDSFRNVCDISKYSI